MSTILVVDDMAVIREPMAASLRLAGYQSLVARNGREALEVARSQPPDLILLDLAMPEMDGLAFLREQQQDDALKQIPVILLTAVTERQSVIEAGRLGVRDYLLKSKFSMKELVGRVQDRLAGGAAAPTAEGDPPQPQQDQAASEVDADASVKGVTGVTPDMTASEVVDHIQGSDHLRSLLDDAQPGA